MQVNDLIFVYGTLRRGESNDLSSWRAGSAVRFVGEATIGGELYDCGWYPGVKNPDNFGASDSVVHGEVFEIMEEGVVDRLDDYEGYPSLYDRTQVVTDGGHRVWVYVFLHDVDPEKLIKSGDWTRTEDRNEMYSKERICS